MNNENKPASSPEVAKEDHPPIKTAKSFMEETYGPMAEGNQDLYLTWLGVAELARQYFMEASNAGQK